MQSFLRMQDVRSVASTRFRIRGLGFRILGFGFRRGAKNESLSSWATYFSSGFLAGVDFTSKPVRIIRALHCLREFGCCLDVRLKV